ncbi:P-type conjugative transfer ATPase TrbB [Selenomonas sp. AB3002]|uniref:P-type conjugative transfer ATPase TrbB n=1 Tax=Selenomonas sp. AB3002 TaxID=1392502 RepID=UPI000495A4F1
MANTQLVNERYVQMLESNMGPQLMAYMQDETITEIMLNPDGHIWIDTHDRGLVESPINMSANIAKQLIYNVGSLAGRVVPADFPELEAEIPASRLFSSCRFQGELPPIVKAPSFNIRKFGKKLFTLDDYVAQGTMTEVQRQTIMTAIREHKNIIAAGGTASGKTTLLNAILAEISQMNERIVIIEDTSELRCKAPNHVKLQTAPPNMDMDMLLRITLRKSPNRIVVGEVRSKEAMTLLEAWSTGHRGGCCTVHSESAYDTLSRLEELTSRVSMTPQKETVGRAVDVVVYLRKKVTKRLIEDIILVNGYNKQTGDYDIEKIG